MLIILSITKTILGQTAQALSCHEYYFMTQIQVHAFRANKGVWFQNHPYFCGLKFGCSTQCGNLMVLIRLSISHPVWV